MTGAVDEPGFVGAAFAARADRTPDRIAVDTGTAPLAAGALLWALEAVAAAIRPGEVVAVTARNDGATLARILGIARAGGLAATLDPSWPATQRDAALAALAPDRVLDGTEPGGTGSLPPPPLGGAPFYAGFTSGSSGVPKVFRRSHRSWVETFRVGRDAFGLSADDRVLVPGPLAHSLFLYAALDALDRGARVALLPRFDAAAVAARLRAGADRLVLVPTMIAALDGSGPFPGVRTVLVGGARLEGALEAAAERLFPQAEIVEFYGASELSFVAWRSNRRPVATGATGRPFPGVEIAIRDDTGRDRPSGEAGTVWVRSPMLAFPSADFRVEGGWGTAGDVGTLDPDGTLRLLGRAGDMIISGGLNLYPAAVEAVIAADPAVAACLVLGRPHPYWGEEVTAVIEPRPGAVPRRDVLREACRAALPRHAVPRAFLTVTTMPRTGSGKPARAAIRAAVLAGDPAYRPLP